MTDIIQDISTESLIIGCLFRQPVLFTEYLEMISTEHDFSDVNLKFLYNLLVDTYMNHDVINETSINIQVYKMPKDSQKLYKELGGFNTFEKLSNVSEVSDFKKVYEKMKTFNVLRSLNKKGFAVKQHLDILKDKNVDQILKAYELQLVKIGSMIQGINDSVRLGDDIDVVYENLKETPDIGIELPFPIVNTYMRGWRLSKLNALGLHSGLGKSRMVVFILCYISIIYQTPTLLLINEQDKLEIDLMILTCIANNVFSQKYGVVVDESDIATGICTGSKHEMLKEASQYIKQRSKLYLQELSNWDYDTLKIIFKKHKLKGINHIVLDTMKPMRGIDTKGMAEWQQFSYTAEQLKRLIGTVPKGGLNMALWITLQLTDESLITKVLNSSSIANAKHIKHVIDYLQMSRMITYKEKEKIKVKLNMPGNPFNGQEQSLDFGKDYYLTTIDKNRGGKDKLHLIYEVNKGCMLWKEIGFAVFGGD